MDYQKKKGVFCARRKRFLPGSKNAFFDYNLISKKTQVSALFLPAKNHRCNLGTLRKRSAFS